MERACAREIIVSVHPLIQLRPHSPHALLGQGSSPLELFEPGRPLSHDEPTVGHALPFHLTFAAEDAEAVHAIANALLSHERASETMVPSPMSAPSALRGGLRESASARAPTADSLEPMFEAPIGRTEALLECEGSPAHLPGQPRATEQPPRGWWQARAIVASSLTMAFAVTLSRWLAHL